VSHVSENYFEEVGKRAEHQHKLILESLKIWFVGKTKQTHFVGVTSDLCTWAPSICLWSVQILLRLIVNKGIKLHLSALSLATDNKDYVCGRSVLMSVYCWSRLRSTCHRISVICSLFLDARGTSRFFIFACS
jgi:hypothetical protein